MPDPAPKPRPLSDDQAHSIAELFYKLCQDPKTRKGAARLIKQSGFDPSLARQFTDVELEDRLEQERQEREEAETRRRAEESVQTQARKRSALLQPGPDGAPPRYTEAQVTEIETLMTQYGVGDYDAGVVLYKGAAPPPNPDPVPPPGERMGATWEFPTVGNLAFKDFAADPTKASRDVAYNVISEFRRGRRAA